MVDGEERKVYLLDTISTTLSTGGCSSSLIFSSMQDVYNYIGDMMREYFDDDDIPVWTALEAIECLEPSLIHVYQCDDLTFKIYEKEILNA